jgi:hypothetical protein
MDDEEALWQAIADTIEGLSLLNHGLLELLLAKGVIEKAEIDDMFSRLSRGTVDWPVDHPGRLAIQAARDDAAELFFPEWISTLRARHRRLFGKKD